MTERVLGEIVRRRRPETLPATATVQAACTLMRDKRIGAILVTGEDGGLVGLFTGRDAVCRIGAEARDPATTRLDEVMTRHPDTMEPKARATDALWAMRDGGYRHLPLVEGRRIVGIVSTGDFSGLEQARFDEQTGFWEIL